MPLLLHICMMFTSLKKKGKVSSTDFFWIMICFAVTGTTTAWISKSITGWLEISQFSWLWWTLKISVLLIGYQIFLLFFGFCFGRFWFFWKYEKKLLSRLGILPKQKILLAIFASGAGSNAKKIIDYFKNHPSIKVSLIVCNKPGAGVINIANANGINILLINNADLVNGFLLKKLSKKKINWIVLAGFLLKIPAEIIQAFPNRIINIHPALLPAYGGQGMYGNRVHAAVLQNKELFSGISIHFVDEHYDHGEIIAQHNCPVNDDDTTESLAEKIHILEHIHFAPAIEQVITNAK